MLTFHYRFKRSQINCYELISQRALCHISDINYRISSQVCNCIISDNCKALCSVVSYKSL